MPERAVVFTKDNLDGYLKALAKEYRRLVRRSMPAEIILVGGAAILGRYGFREMTTDIDAVIHASSAMEDAIRRVGDQHGLPAGWLNTDFERTGSYSPKLDEFSVHYREYYGVLRVRIIAAEYLIAMKLRAGRKYKNDLSDVVGILAEHEKSTPITMEQIDKAVHDLYGGWSEIPADSRIFLEDIFQNGNYGALYEKIMEEERIARTALGEMVTKYPGVVKQDNVDDILKQLRAKQERKE